MEVTVRNSDIAKFGTREELKTKLTDYINRRGPRTHEKTTEAKILSHIKECTRIQKGNRKMKHRKRETGSGVSSNKSNIARAMRVRMPKVPDNFAPQVIPEIPEAAPEQQIITERSIYCTPAYKYSARSTRIISFSSNNNFSPYSDTNNQAD